jgi:ABC-type cobalamin transport system ATPase subunit
MTGRSDLRHTLRQARDVLHELRRNVAAAGHAESMQEIDSLVAVAEIEVERKLKESERAQPKPPRS